MTRKASARTLPTITCVFVDVNGLHALNNERGHKMLRIVAEALRQNFDYYSTFRIGGDEFVAFSETEDEERCNEKMLRVLERVTDSGYSISYGVVGFRNETGLDRLVREADERMLKSKGIYYINHDRRRS